MFDRDPRGGRAAADAAGALIANTANRTVTFLPMARDCKRLVQRGLPAECLLVAPTGPIAEFVEGYDGAQVGSIRGAQ